MEWSIGVDILGVEPRSEILSVTQLRMVVKFVLGQTYPITKCVTNA